MKNTIKKQIFLDNEELPGRYDTTGITLVTCEPHLLYAYWEIDGNTIAKVKEKITEPWEQITNVIRMYDVTCIDFNGMNANHWFDIEVEPFAKHKYISMGNENTSYCCDLGLRTSSGEFFSLARSNFITTQKSSMTPHEDFIWKNVEENNEAALPFVKYGDPVRNNKNFFNVTKCQFATPVKMNLTHDDIRSYYLGGVSPKQKDSGEGAPVAEPIKESIQVSEWRAPVLESGKAGVFEDTIQQGLFEKGYFKSPLLGSSGGIGWSGEISQPEIKERKEQKDFFFELETELIVRGRTQPGAKVTLEGKNIPLAPDGTFALKYFLPDGKIPLNFKAKSQDKQHEKFISTSVERNKTKYD